MGLLSEDFLKVSEGIVGTCQDIEISYVRITSHPDPKTVRPEPVLRLALAKVKERERRGRDYEECQDLYMSICQDLRLQQLHGQLAVEVREGFAQCAMRARTGVRKSMDVKALSDSLLHLHALYLEHPGQPRELEFALYRMLLWLALAQEGDEQQTGWVRLAPAVEALHPHRVNGLVKHGMGVLAAVSEGDVVGYFAHVHATPADAVEARNIYDTMLSPVMRMRGYKAVLKAYKMQIPCRALQRRLGLPSPGAVAEWVTAQGAVLVGHGEEAALDVDESRKASPPAAQEAPA